MFRDLLYRPRDAELQAHLHVTGFNRVFNVELQKVTMKQEILTKKNLFKIRNACKNMK